MTARRKWAKALAGDTGGGGEMPAGKLGRPRKGEATGHYKMSENEREDTLLSPLPPGNMVCPRALSSRNFLFAGVLRNKSSSEPCGKA